MLAPCKARKSVNPRVAQGSRLLCRLELKRLLPMVDKPNSIREVLTLLDPLPLSFAGRLLFREAISSLKEQSGANAC